MDQSILLSGLSSLVCAKVVSPKCTKNGNGKSTQLDANALHSKFMMHGKLGSNSKTKSADTWYQILIKNLKGNNFEVFVKSCLTVRDLKNKIKDREGISSDKQILLLSAKELEDHRTLGDYRIKEGSTIQLVVRLKNGEVPIYELNSSTLDPKYDFDFTHIVDSAVYNRGGYVYKRPYGFMRYAINIQDKYDDNDWLGASDRSSPTSSVINEWPVSYHGTSDHNGKSIAQKGYDLSKGRRFKFGYGIYSAPDINVALLYAPEYKYEGETYKLVMQNRVNPISLEIVKEEDIGDYWISKKDSDIRPYGFCILKC